MISFHLWFLLFTSGLPEQRQERHVPPLHLARAGNSTHSQGISLHQHWPGLAETVSFEYVSAGYGPSHRWNQRPVQKPEILSLGRQNGASRTSFLAHHQFGWIGDCCGYAQLYYGMPHLRISKGRTGQVTLSSSYFNWEIINLIYGAGGRVGVFGCIVCSYEIINLIYGATGAGTPVWFMAQRYKVSILFFWIFGLKLLSLKLSPWRRARVLAHFRLNFWCLIKFIYSLLTTRFFCMFSRSSY